MHPDAATCFAARLLRIGVAVGLLAATAALVTGLVTGLMTGRANAGQRAAPPVQATLLDGGRFDSGAHGGKVIVVNFWATWCPPCREEMPDLDAFYRRHRARGLEVIAISMDEAADRAAVERVARAYGFPVALSAQAQYKGLGRIWRLPMTFVIDRDGRLRDDITGKVGKLDLAFLEARIAPLLAR